MSTYTEFFLGTKSSVVQLELIDISHPDFSKIYRIVRNASNGITVTLETLATEFYEYYPLRLESLGARDNLDAGIRVTLGDLGEVLPVELDNVATNDGFGTKPVLTYRTYSSDDLTAPLFGPLTLETVAFTFNGESAQFEAKAPSLNISETGELYKLARFPTLRGFL